MANDKEPEMDLDAVLGGAEDDNDFALEDVKDTGLDEFLEDVTLDKHNAGFVNAGVSEENESSGTDELAAGAPLDFASFDIDDFDAALNSFQAARAGKLPKSVPMPPPSQPKPQPKAEVKPQPQPEKKAAVPAHPEHGTEALPSVHKPVDEVVSVSDNSEQKFEIEREDIPVSVAEPKIRTTQTRSGSSGLFNPATVDESGFKENTAERQQDILNWYSGELKDKTYEISPENMPEFLDTDKTIRVLHVTVDSTYGWNVFFDNGVFMSLRDLKEYQERHGEIPCQDGKIIYGGKTTSFERILRVVVYERPRYFSYVVK